MIHRVFSTLARFKKLEFHAGLNVLIAQKETGSTAKQTRNRAGKTSLIELIHFLAGSSAGKDSLFRSPALLNESFGMTLDLRGTPVTVERSGETKARVLLTLPKSKGKEIANKAWSRLLGEKMFDIEESDENDLGSPTFRTLFSYFVRRQTNGAFTTPEKAVAQQQPGDYQVALMFLLGLDWDVAREWERVREREKTLKELRRAAGTGVFGSVIGKAADLRTQVMVAEAGLRELRAQLSGFQVLPQYAALEAEADDLTGRINRLVNGNVVDAASVRDLRKAMASESPPAPEDLELLYREAGVALPGAAIQRYEEVRAFHESVVRNRRDYLAAELEEATRRIRSRDVEKSALDTRRSELLNLLQSHGALKQLTALQAKAARFEADLEGLRQRYAAAEQLEGTKNELDLERGRLELRLRREFTEQQAQIEKVILAFERTSKKLYESAGSMTIEVTRNGPMFQFPMQGSRSKGIKNMQIFCFDLMLMRLCAERRVGPGFLVHDSHLFDGVDGRQIISALKVGAETAQELGFQYVVTMNEDDAFKEVIDGFDLEAHVLPVVLTDAAEDGGLFGFRF